MKCGIYLENYKCEIFKVCPQILCYFSSKGEAQFCSPWVWAWLSDSLLMNRKWWEWQRVTSEYCASLHKAHGFLLALEPLALEEVRYKLWGYNCPLGKSVWWGTEASCQQPWVSFLGSWSLSPGQAFRWLKPQPTSWLPWWEILRQNYPAKPFSNFRLKEIVQNNIYGCFKPPSFEYFVM